MVCIIAAVVLAFVVRYFLLKYRLETEVGHLAIFYPCVVVLSACRPVAAFFQVGARWNRLQQRVRKSVSAGDQYNHHSRRGALFAYRHTGHRYHPRTDDASVRATFIEITRRLMENSSRFPSKTCLGKKRRLAV